MLLISIVGVVLGWVRYDTGSTAGSTFMHSTFNLTQLAAFLANPNS
jgi:membrane protease YdiL (CAAX protease family)